MPRDEGVLVAQQQIIAIRPFPITYIERYTPMTLGNVRELGVENFNDRILRGREAGRHAGAGAD
jgi:hypothetical protein